MNGATSSSANSYRPGHAHADLLLRETNHRCSNDLQLVVSLLRLQSRRATNAEAGAALNDAAERIAVLARGRATVVHHRSPDPETALRQVCEALQPYAEARSILISFRVDRPPTGLLPDRITTLALVVNELLTNAIKHAFEDGRGGRISVALGGTARRDVVVTVDDDGAPHAGVPSKSGGGLGLTLVRRLMASIDGLLIPPEGSSKMFELRVPAGTGRMA